MQSAISSRFWRLVHRLILPMSSFITRLHLISFLSSIVSANLADTPIWEIFGIPADMLSNLTLFSPLSIPGQIDWHAWLIFPWLGEHLPSDYSVLIFCVNTGLEIVLLWPLIIVPNKASLQNQLQNPALATLKNLTRLLAAQLEEGYCSITVANHRLIIVIRFVAKSYTIPKKVL